MDNLRRAIVPAVFVVVAFAVFWTQNEKVGFERGHHGWVTSHTLAILDKANLENGFVGFALRLVKPDGTKHFDYFDRYPVLFSVAMNRLFDMVHSPEIHIP